MLRIEIRALLIALLLLTGIVVDAGQVSAGARSSRSVRTLKLKGGVLATFTVEGQQFKVWIKNPEAIKAVFALQAGTSTANIPNGRLRAGAGIGDHNAPWTWHLDPNDIEFADATIELCDATPSYIQKNLRSFIREVGNYCPWLAELVSIQDYR